MATVSPTSTKAEILKVYEETLKALEQERKENATLRKDLDQKRQVADKGAQLVQQDVTQGIISLRQQLLQQLDEIETGLLKEKLALQTLQEAIQVEKKNLEELYQIRVQAESLDALIATYKQSKDKLEKEAAEQKRALDADINDRKIQWNREKEDYEYHLALQRRKETDAHNEKKSKQELELTEAKAAFEKTASEREKTLAQQEEEVQKLRQQAAQFEKDLAKAAQDTEKSVSERLKKDFEYQRQLEMKDLQSELRLAHQDIENLKTKVKEQQELIQALSSKSDTATQQVKDIALRAIEHAGRQPIQISSDRNKDD